MRDSLRDFQPHLRTESWEELLEFTFLGGFWKQAEVNPENEGGTQTMT